MSRATCIVTPQRPGIEGMARWLARVVVDQALAERRDQSEQKDVDARSDLLTVQQREAI